MMIIRRLFLTLASLVLLSLLAPAQSTGAQTDTIHGTTVTPEPPTRAANALPPADQTNSAANTDAAAASRSTPGQDNFVHRFFRSYRDDWRGTTASGPEAKYRGYPSPESDPPFPFADWPYGGSPVMGKPWTQSSPLMQALWSGPHGDAWKKSRIQIYGWLNTGFNLSTSTRGHYGNSPGAYAVVPNSIQPDQEVLYIERQPDTVQTDHFDWGFRLAQLYGIDYRFTTAKGIFSQQLLARTNADGSIGKEYGYDPVMAYVDLYFPHVAQGLNVRIGRYISLPDIEAQLAPNNYTYSHSILYTFDAYTQSGINATVKLGNRWMLQVGLSAGNDVAPWTSDAKPTLNTCVAYTWQNGNDNHYACLNSLNDGKYAYNNVQSVYYTWFHKISPSWHTGTEWWHMWEKAVPNVANPGAASLLEINANGAVCQTPQQLTCFAPETAVVNYVEKQFSSKNYMTIRNEFFDDIKGQRTGFKTKYSEHLIGWGHWVGTTILFRPELRFERSYTVPVYANGTKKNQFTLAGDVIYFF